MKKNILILCMLGASALTVSGQTLLKGTKFTDNWSFGINGGVTTPMTHSAFWKNSRPAVGIELSKRITPVLSLGTSVMGHINTSSSKTAFDASDVSLLGKVNLMNLFAGYQGTPRLFEIEAVAGIGWLHYYMNGPGDENSWSTRLGLNLNFNLGESKAWTLGVKPAIVYDMQGDFNTAKSRFNANNAAFELTAGLAYHFKTSNGTHHFTTVKPYNAAEIAELNSSINNLRSQVGSKDSQLATTTRQVNELQSELDACRNKVVPVETVIKTDRIPESVITFRQGKSVVDASQLPNVERIASYLKKHPDANVIIKGYASPEGNLEFNKKLAKARAEAVESILVKKYKIDSTRVSAEGQGIGDMFTDPDWNRVSICTIDESK